MSTLRLSHHTHTRDHSTPRTHPRRMHLELLDAIAVITLDHAEKSANIIDPLFLDELEVALSVVRRAEAKGLIFLSAKPSVFVAGADLETLIKARSIDLDALIERGQTLFREIAVLPIPTVAAIHGACLGGGLELALACDRRIASDAKETKLGLPETLLGILPAWGGSTRLSRLIGLPAALRLILSGKSLAPRSAKKLGLVDEIVPREHLRERALELLTQPPTHRRRFRLRNSRLSGFLLRLLMRPKLKRQTHGHYPALLSALDVVTRGASGSLATSLQCERYAVLSLATTETAKQLMRLFFLQEEAKHRRYATALDPKSLAPIERSAVVGAGVMGAGIAQTFASRGYPVILSDITPDRTAAGMRSVLALFDEAVKRRIFSQHEADRHLDRITPIAEPVPLHRCDLVVEAAVEDLAIKQKIFADLCTRSRSDTILATNTSALPITELARSEGVTHPERLLGLHFFNPVSRMKLVEVVVTEYTSDDVVERVLAFVRRLGKIPVVVKDSPGFLVNRILMPYLIEAGQLAESGIPVGHIDRAMLDFGMPMGPLRLLDEIGLDVATHVAKTMSAAFGERFAVPPLLARLNEQDHLGKKRGRGFYLHHGKKTTPVKFGTQPSFFPSREKIADRLVGLMSAEAQRCLDEGIVSSADEIDLAMILGTGFAPFRGGPLTYARTTEEAPLAA